MNDFSLSVPAWLVRCLTPLVTWGVSRPFPHSLAKRAGVALAALVLRLAVRRDARQWGYGGCGPHDKPGGCQRPSGSRARGWVARTAAARPDKQIGGWK